MDYDTPLLIPSGQARTQEHSDSDDTVGLGAPISQSLATAPEDIAVLPSVLASAFDSSEDGRSPEEDQEEPGMMDSRAYQLEMFEKSLERNIIVAMDTGSGKTQIALLRMRAELDRCSPDKIVWFLAPTVFLSQQQFELIQLQMPSTPAKLLTGNDNLHAWSGQVWKVILQDVRIVVSTPKVLSDALTHGYVSIGRLALLVFDEAHNCVKKDPGSMIMVDFYHPNRWNGKPVPYILGLTASPSMQSKMTEVEKLEALLDAQCASPTVHREELLRHVKKPQIDHRYYTLPLTPENTVSLLSLQQVYWNLKITEDPYIVSLASNPTEKDLVLLKQAIEKKDTYTQNQMKIFNSRSRTIALELGAWAADRYIHKVIESYLAKPADNDATLHRHASLEREYLRTILNSINAPKPPEEATNISSKGQILVRELLAIQGSPVCIIFARERATVSVLLELLSACPQIASTFRMGALVGASNYSSKKRDIFDLSDNTKLNSLVLQRFRSGHINLLIATSVLEEGIDVPACNLVICFDKPSNYKSFIQRRGRARMRDSKVVLLCEDSGQMRQQWEAMEAEMKQQFEDEERQRHNFEVLEAEMQGSHEYLEVESTGAKLGFDGAKQHLEHFCRTLSMGEFVDARPDYIIHPGPSNGRITATVLLPPFLPPDLRRAKSRYEWKSEKNATKDAAFQAYAALYNAGLINDHLLPFKPDQIPGVETRASIADIEALYDPWPDVLLAWQSGATKWSYTFTCYNENGLSLGEYDIILPVWLDQPQPIRIYRDYETLWELRSTPARPLSDAEVDAMPDHTSILLESNFGHRWGVEDKAHVIKVSSRGIEHQLNQIDRASLQFNLKQVKDHQYLVRDPKGVPYLYQGCLPSKPAHEMVRRPFEDYELAPADVPYLVLKKWTRRADFLHPLLADPESGLRSTKLWDYILPMAWAQVDSLSMDHVQFGMLIPSIIHEFGIMLTAKHLASTLLQPIEDVSPELVRTAITASSAMEPVNYERIELLGDSVLKYCTTVLACSLHPEWPEGYLSFFKDRLVSNSRLSKASLESGLTKFILTNPFTGTKWRPLYLDSVTNTKATPNSERKLSTKTIADVVEALIGAAYQSGGISQASKCIAIFLTEQNWPSPSECRQKLYDFQPESNTLPSTLAPLEDLLQYCFQKKTLLVEATTHSSFMAGGAPRTLERLEFLGDAVLDQVIVTRLFAVNPPLSHDKMHLLKTTIVNGDFLAFCALEVGVLRHETVVTDECKVETENTTIPLWKFMRHSSTDIGVKQNSTAERHRTMRGEIIAAMETGTHYPWALLSKLEANKFMSDMVEAIIGAVWIDSGSLDKCEALIDRLGITKYLDRIIRDHVEVQHPKEVLGIYAGNEKVEYRMEIIPKVDGGREYICTVFVGDRFVVTVANGAGKDEAKTSAATEAVRILAARRSGGQMDLD